MLPALDTSVKTLVHLCHCRYKQGMTRTQIPPHEASAGPAIWLDAAYDLLLEGGVDAVKILPLAQRLGQSRTSFYWHFKDRKALLEALIQRWESLNTDHLVARAQAYAEDIGEACFNLFDCWLDNRLFDTQLELAIRAWANADSALKLRVDAADEQRLTAVQAMFERFGYTGPVAQVRAMTLLFTQHGYMALGKVETDAERVARMPAYIEVFTGQRPSARQLQRFCARHHLAPPANALNMQSVPAA